MIKNKFKYLIASAALMAAFLSAPLAHADETSSNSSSSQNQSSAVANSSSSSSTSTDQNNSEADKQSSSSSSSSNTSTSSSSTSSSSSKQSSTATTAKKKTKTTKTTTKVWKTINGKKYYLVNGKKTTGYKKIGNYWYVFNKNGVVLTGVRKIPNKSTYGYFNAAGHRQFKNTKTSKAYYWINKSGTITGIKNYAKVISQLPEMPTGCEITAVTMMINFAGVKVTKQQAAKVMHYSSNPNKGFIGSPYKKWPGSYWVAPNGIKSVVKHYLGTSQVMTGASMTSIKKKLLRSHCVVMWVGMFDGISNHAITLTGYHNGLIYFMDPWTGTKRSIKESTLKVHWALDAHRALSY